MAEAAGKSGKGGLIVTLGALTVLACVGGGLVGKLVVARVHAAAAPEPTTPDAKKAPTYGDEVEVRELPAIITNLAKPAHMRVRLQVALVYPKKGVENAAVLAAEVGEDLVAFMKTVSIGEIEGASGLHNLSEDLTDRAATRSQGKVREVIIETLVMQ